ncbi:hypothetical protein AB1L88_06010 [Tautonia sp. JC769]|uniref:hypothetical protein n=1 Tax=Tautonia sp. JC769 TaxID=3232135 RepID=UPI003457CE9F
MRLNLKTLSLVGALVAGGLVVLGSPTPAAAQFGPGFGHRPGFGIGPGGGFGGISVNVGIGRTSHVAPGGCHLGCKSACGHVRPPRFCPPPVPPVCGVPGYGYGYGKSVYREYRTGYGVPGHVGFPGRGGHGRFPGYGRHPGYGW